MDRNQRDKVVEILVDLMEKIAEKNDAPYMKADILCRIASVLVEYVCFTKKKR